MLKRRLKEPFGKAGLVVGVVALVFAMFGGAYAATSSSGGGKATASAKQGKRGKQGKQGKTGKTGPAGPAGPQGPAGAPGAKGDTGAAGSSGTSVSGTPVAAGQEGCVAGGVKYASASGNNVVCNGKNGTNGTTGFTDTLPGGKTETGVWAFGEVTAAAAPESAISFFRYPISFNIPLAQGLTGTECNVNPPPAGCRVHFINPAGEEVLSISETTTSTACTGDAAAPTASPGHLCVYAGELEFARSQGSFIATTEPPGPVGASPVGAVLKFRGVAAGAFGYGSWAVTAENE